MKKLSHLPILLMGFFIPLLLSQSVLADNLDVKPTTSSLSPNQQASLDNSINKAIQANLKNDGLSKSSNTHIEVTTKHGYVYIRGDVNDLATLTDIKHAILEAYPYAIIKTQGLVTHDPT